jgi:hypothetical protein
MVDEAQQQIAAIEELYGYNPHPRPYALHTVPEYLVETVMERIAAFVDQHNATLAVAEAQWILPCWAAHPRLVAELAALYAAWVEATETPIASPTLLLAWYDRHLPGFHSRLREYFGTGSESCNRTGHRADWNPALRPRAGAPAAAPPTEGELTGVLDALTNPPAAFSE